jgi:phosphoribosylamine--glycine ligase
LFFVLNEIPTNKMKIFVIGSGGREHAIVWKLKQDASVEKILCAPGNGGIENEVECRPLDLSDVSGAAALAAKLGADLTIVGPELPLVLGIADEFKKRGLAILAPERNAARLEGSKIFAKEFLLRHGIPTAAVLGICDSTSEARAVVASGKGPLVIKADGLCAGKGVLVTSSADEAGAFIERLIEKREFGDAGRRLLIEDALTGDEISYIIITDGTNFVPMAAARDHKRAYDNDEGPNTGGMGVYSIEGMLPTHVENEILEKIVRPTLAGLKKDGVSYCGFLYFGLMLTPDGPKVLEYNCRLGDPETEAVLLRANFDFAEVCFATVQGRLGTLPFQIRWSSEASVCVVLASEGYPENPKVGREITGLDEASRIPGSVILHAGTRRDGAQYYSTGGRVLMASAKAQNLKAARKIAYEAIAKIKLDGSYYRKDIGLTRTLKQKAVAEPGNS